MDAEPRKYGVRSVFDTLVVHTVNNGCRRTSAMLTQSTSPGKQPQGRGPKEIGGSLLKRWGMWFNSTIHGAPYQPPWWLAPPLTRGWGRAAQRRCMAVVSSCCEAWPWVAKRTQPTCPPPRGWPVGDGRHGFGGWAPGAAGSPAAGGVAEVKSIWPTSAGPHTCHKGPRNGPRRRRPEQPPNAGLSSDCGLQVARMKPKPLVIVHQDVTVKQDQALHTPPITLGKCGQREGGAGGGPRPWPDRGPGDLSEVDTR